MTERKKMFELLNVIKETYVLHLPQSQKRAYAKDIWYEEIKLLKEHRWKAHLLQDMREQSVRQF